MKILLDMNLSPLWCDFLAIEDWIVLHWSTIGAYNAPDEEIFQWAKENNYIIFTNDLDFGTILAVTNADSPSVIQIKTQDLMPDKVGQRVIQVIKENQHILKEGALVTIDNLKMRIRILPLRNK